MLMFQWFKKTFYTRYIQDSKSERQNPLLGISCWPSFCVHVITHTRGFPSDTTLYYSFKHWTFRSETDHPQEFQYKSLKNKLNIMTGKGSRKHRIFKTWQQNHNIHHWTCNLQPATHQITEHNEGLANCSV